MLVTMWFVAPSGIAWVAAVHLVVQVVFVLLRQVIVDGIIGAKGTVALSCLVPGTVVAACVTAAALPVRLSTQEGFLSLVAVTVAGIVGGLVALAVFPPARRELMGLFAKLRGR